MVCYDLADPGDLICGETDALQQFSGDGRPIPFLGMFIVVSKYFL